MGNQIKTVLLLGILTGVLLVIGSFFGRGGLMFAGIFVVAMNIGSYWFSHKMVLMMYRAKEVTENDEPRLYKLVREVKDLAGVPMPKVYIIPSDNPNAFATGRNPSHAVVAATKGILELLNDDELKGVIAHEFAHIKNRDILISTVAGTIAGVISYVAFMARWGAIFGGFGGRDGEGSNILELLALAIIAPLTATIIRLAISRSREFIADETGARIIHSQHGLVNALEKLHSNVKDHPMRFGGQATEHLFIVNPFTKGAFLKLFSTHPSLNERVSKLKELHL
ncbi:MAG: protease HtpX [Nanoarchaeota archaeon]|nr:protease HtpX [Nanoarchaeota archaeon]